MKCPLQVFESLRLPIRELPIGVIPSHSVIFLHKVFRNPASYLDLTQALHLYAY